MFNNIPCYAPVASTTLPTQLAHESLVQAVRDALHLMLSSMVEHHTLMQSALTTLREQQLVLADQQLALQATLSVLTEQQNVMHLKSEKNVWSPEVHD